MILNIGKREWAWKVNEKGEQEFIVPKKESYTREELNCILGAINKVQEFALMAIQATDPEGGQ